MNNLGMNEYLESRVMTAPPEQLHLMVVDGAIRHAKIALAAIEKSNVEEAHLALTSSREFVAELFGGLSADQNPELVGHLKQVFGFAYQNLVKADMDQEQELVADAIRLLESHRNTWLELIEKLQADKIAENEPDSGLQGPHTTSWST